MTGSRSRIDEQAVNAIASSRLVRCLTFWSGTEQTLATTDSPARKAVAPCLRHCRSGGCLRQQRRRVAARWRGGRQRFVLRTCALICEKQHGDKRDGMAAAPLARSRANGRGDRNTFVKHFWKTISCSQIKHDIFISIGGICASKFAGSGGRT
jgi:hypothetical protein